MQKELTSSQEVKVWLVTNNRTHRWLAGKLGVSDSTLSKILTGRMAPSGATQRRLHKITGVEFSAAEQAA